MILNVRKLISKQENQKSFINFMVLKKIYEINHSKLKIYLNVYLFN